MAKAKKPKNEDPEQSRRFLDTVRELEDAGELSPTAGQRSFDALVQKVLRPAKRKLAD